MADRDNTSKARPGRNSVPKARSASSPPKAASLPNSRSLEDIVEDERARLMKAHSILSCAVTAMENEAVCTNDGPYWPSVIESARDLINESIRRLEDLDYSAKPTRSKNEVREPALVYGYGTWAESESFSTSDSDARMEEYRCDSATRRAAEDADIAAALEPLPKAVLLN